MTANGLEDIPLHFFGNVMLSLSVSDELLPSEDDDELDGVVGSTRDDLASLVQLKNQG